MLQMPTTSCFTPAIVRTFLAGLIVAAMSGPAVAQISTAGGVYSFSHFSTQGLVKGTDVEYDPVNRVFLVVASCYTTCPSGSVYGRFVDANGAPVGGIFTISPAGNGHFPRAEYGEAVNGGNGGFLVTWTQEQAGGNQLYGRVVRYTSAGGQALGTKPVQLSDGATPAWAEAGAGIAYSPTSQNFLVAWMAYSPFRVVSRLVHINAAPLTGIRQLSAAYGQDPSVAWNASTNQYGVSFSAENSAGSAGFSVFARVSATDGAMLGRQSFNQISGFARITDVAYSPLTKRWVMAWAQGLFGSPGWETQIAEIGANGQVINMGLATRRWVGYNSVAIANSPVTNTMLLVSIPPTDETSGLELNRHGFPISSVTALAPGFTTRYARVVGNVHSARWAVSFSNNYESGRVFAVRTTSTAGGGTKTHAAYSGTSTGSGSGGSTGGTSTPTAPKGCTTPDPFVSIGGGTCLGNNVWVPGKTSGSTGGTTGGSTGSGTTGGSTSGGGIACTAKGSSPVPGWVCVGDGWVPPTHPLASKAVSGSTGGSTGGTTGGSSLPYCSTTPTWAAGGGWVRVGAGDWVPVGHPAAARAVCRGR